MNWHIEVIKEIESQFAALEVDYKHNNNVQSCLIDFYNLKMKILKPAARSIFISDKIKSIAISTHCAEALSYIQSKILNGFDVNPHLSRKIFEPTYNDLLLNNWMIQHIHLSKSKSQSNQYYYNRSDYLLFAMFNDSQAFLIDIRRHNEKDVFAKQELIEIIYQNWPTLLREDNSEEAELFSNSYTDAEINILRKKGYSVVYTNVNGKHIINPNLGITTNGSNLFVVQKANNIIRYIQETLIEIETNEAKIINELSLLVNKKIETLDFCIKYTDTAPIYFGVYEKTANCYISKDYGR